MIRPMNPKSSVSHRMPKTLVAGLMGLVLLSPLLGGCVTVNVNFPESAVQKATDDYVKDLYRMKNSGPKGAEPASVPSQTPQAKGAWILDLMTASAMAEEGFSVNSAESSRIREKLRARLDDVLAQKKAGVLGEDKNGLIVIKDPSKLKKLLAQKVEKLVADENADRMALYNDVVKSNGFPSSRLANIQRSFARSFQAESPSGTWVEDVDSGWTQKP
jgi:uncharacterized protein YdbL (DUF1318 family)